jgi:DNA-binding NtrC family response regulator
MNGVELLQHIRREYPHIAVLMVTADGSVEKAVECMQYGAVNYVVKPTHTSQLIGMVAQTLSKKAIEDEYASLRRHLLNGELEHPEAFEGLLTCDPRMRSVLSYVEVIAKTSEPVLITGETGTGKELIAQAVHRCSERTGAFVAVNVAGLDDGAFSDTLFGHKRGAYTGAIDDRKGLIEQARGGTLFLDEMGSLDAHSQVKLLRLIQEGEYFPLGVDAPRIADIRLVAATNNDLQRQQDEGAFRRDLYYRLNTHRVHVPPLRERPNDLPLLAVEFLKQAAELYGCTPARLNESGHRVLRGYSFPGNVRELRALMMDAAVRQPGAEIPAGELEAILPEAAGACEAPPGSAAASQLFSSLRNLPPLHQMQEDLIREALHRTEGNQSAAAGILGISRQALHQRLQRAKQSASSVLDA